MDYLVKPFEYQRFKLALNRFHEKRMYLTKSHEALNQYALDQLFSRTDINPEPPFRLSKGLNDVTLQKIHSFLASNPDTFFASEQVAEQMELSRITVSRKLIRGNIYEKQTMSTTCIMDCHLLIPYRLHSFSI